jgi:uncharacterized protein
MNFSKPNFVFLLMSVSIVILVAFNFLSPYGMFKLPQFNLVQQTTPATKQLTVGKTTVSVEVADTPKAREIGLMNRKSLAKNTGMVFIFEEGGRYPFWMKNTLIPLDIIWIGSDLKVAGIMENLPPCPPATVTCPTYSPGVIARYVLEVNAGWVKEHEISKNMQVAF